MVSTLIEIVLSKKEHILFVAEARKRMRIKCWSTEDLAKQINRPVSSVYNFFSKNRKPSRYLAAEIAKALDMNKRYWKEEGSD